MQGIKALKKILQSVNKKIGSTKKLDSQKIQIKLVDPNRLNCY